MATTVTLKVSAIVSRPLETLPRPLQSFSQPIQALSSLEIIFFQPSNGRNKLSHGLHKHSQGLFKHSHGLKMPDIAFMLKSLYLIFFFCSNLWRGVAQRRGVAQLVARQLAVRQARV